MANSLKAGMFLIESRMADAAMGDVDALYELGVAYSTGTGGVEIDFIEAHKWFNLAALKGNVARAGMPRRHRRGHDRPRDRRSPARRPRLARRHRRPPPPRGVRPLRHSSESWNLPVLSERLIQVEVSPGIRWNDVLATSLSYPFLNGVISPSAPISATTAARSRSRKSSTARRKPASLI